MDFFKNSKAELRSYDIDGELWFVLDDVLKALKLGMADIKTLEAEEPEDFKTLDSKMCINEAGFYYLIIFESKTIEAQAFAQWVLGSVVPSVLNKGYFKVGEDSND